MALRADGSTALRLGVVDEPVFPRSANKPLQAVALLEAGWVPPDSETLALATSSHSGQPEHLEVVRRTLAAAGLDEEALQCPSMLPLSEPAAALLLAGGGSATALTMNCSGKHAAMLACCVARGWDTADYLAPDSPVQRAVLGTSELLGLLGCHQVDAGGRAGDQRAAAEDAGLARPVEQQEGEMLLGVSRCADRAQGEPAEVDLFAVLEPTVRELPTTGSRREHLGAVSGGELDRAGEEVGVEVGVGGVRDMQASGRGLRAQ